MSFTLEVDFSGLCLYVHDPATERAAVLMPDARELLPSKGPHADGTFGAAHAGYLRFNLADMADLPDQATGFPPGDDERPRYEGVHVFNRKVLSFETVGGDSSGPIVFTPSVPRLEDFAPYSDSTGSHGALLVPVDGLFSSAPPASLLMRTILSGGTLTGPIQRENWFIPNLFNPGQPATAGVFASVVRWTRQVDSLVVVISAFDGSSSVRIPLRPSTSTNSVVRLKVANLCATNPMEWQELGVRPVESDDVDFKWLYRLLTPRSGTYGDLLKGHRLPIPMMPAARPEGVEDCLGVQTTASIPG